MSCEFEKCEVHSTLSKQMENNIASVVTGAVQFRLHHVWFHVVKFCLLYCFEFLFEIDLLWTSTLTINANEQANIFLWQIYQLSLLCLLINFYPIVELIAVHDLNILYPNFMNNILTNCFNILYWIRDKKISTLKKKRSVICLSNSKRIKSPLTVYILRVCENQIF